MPLLPHDPTASADRRWQRALVLAQPRRRCCKMDNELTRLAVTYLRRRKRHPDRPVPTRLAAVHAAAQIHDAGGRRRWLLEGHALACTAVDEVAGLLSLSPATV